MSLAKIIYIINTLGLKHESLLKKFANTRSCEPDYVLHLLNTYPDVFAKENRNLYYMRLPKGIMAWGMYYFSEVVGLISQTLEAFNTDELLVEEPIEYLTESDMLAIIEVAKTCYDKVINEFQSSNRMNEFGFFSKYKIAPYVAQLKSIDENSCM